MEDLNIHEYALILNDYVNNVDLGLLLDYNCSKDLLLEEQMNDFDKKSNSNNIALTIVVILCALIALAIIFYTLILPSIKYNYAIDLLNAGDFVAAKAAFVELDGYKDSADYISRFKVVYDKDIYSEHGNLAHISEWEYDSDGNLSKYSRSDPEGQLSWLYEYEYNFVGNRVKELSHSDVGYTWIFEYEYDSNDNIIKEIRTNSDEQTTEIREYVYDSMGNVVKTIVTPHEGETYSSENIHEYDSSGNIIKITRSNHRGEVTLIEEYEYDSNGNTVAEYHTRPEGEAKLINSYEFDSDNKLIRKADLDYTTEYEYDPSGKMVKEIRTDWQNCVYVYDYEYDSWGNLLKKAFVYYKPDGTPGMSPTEYTHTYEGVRLIYCKYPQNS